MKSLLLQFSRQESGASTVERTLIAAIVAVAFIAGAGVLRADLMLYSRQAPAVSTR